MNSVLSYIAGLLVLLLFGALIGPSVVDWNSFRSGIEGQISEATGRHVTIAGDINFVILPTPRFRLDAIEVRPDADAAAFARADMLEGEIALTPLLRGEIEVTRIRARDFEVHLKRDALGHMNWASDQPDAVIGSLDPADVRLDLVTFENGRLRVEDEPSGRSFEFADINGELKAGSLVGPYRFDGAFVLDEELYQLSTSIGAISGDRAFPVNFEFSSPRFKWKTSFSGIATEASLAGRLDGALQMQVGEARKVGELVEPAFMTAKAGFVLSRRQATFRDLEVMALGSPFKGQAVLAYDAAPVLTGRLGGANLPLETFAQAYRALDWPRVSSVVPNGLAGGFNLAVAEASYNGVRARDVSMDVAFEDGALNVKALRGEVPNVANAYLRGVVRMDNRSPRFDGTLTGRVLNLAHFDKWLLDVSGGEVSEGARYASQASGRLDFETSLALKRSLYQAYGFSAIFEDETGTHAPLTGGFSWASQNGKPAFGLEMRGAYADLSFLAGLEARAKDVSAWDFSTLDGNFVLLVDDLKYRGLRYGDVNVSANVKDGVLSIVQAAAHDASAGTAAEGQSADTRVSVSGVLTSLSPQFVGDLSGVLNAPLAMTLAEDYLGRSLASAEAGMLTFRLQGSREQEGQENGSSPEDEDEIRLDVEGKVDGADVTLRARERRADGTAPRMEFSLKIGDPGSSLLPGLLHLPAGAVVEDGELLLTMVGDRTRTMETALLYRVAGAALSLKGDVANPFDAAHFVGRFEAKADTYARLAHQFSLTGRLSDLVAANGRDGAVLATGDVEWQASQLAVRQVEAVAGSFRVSGAAQVDWREARPVLGATLDLGRVSLAHLFDVENGASWSAYPLDWAFLGDASGEFRLTASGVDVAGLALDDVAATASLEDGVLSFSPITASFGDGRMTMGLKLEGGAGVPGVGVTLALEDAELDAATKMVFGAPLAAGTVTGNLQLEGRGRSQLGLVSTLSGRGHLTLRSGSFAGFDLLAFRQGVEGLQDIEQFTALADLTLRNGANGFDLVDGALGVDEGVLTFTGESGEVAGAQSTKISGFADLVRRELDVETVFSLVGQKPLPPLTMVLGGPVRALSRRMDSLSIQAAIAQRLLIKELEASGVKDVPEELLDLIVSPDVPSALDVPLDDALPEGGDARPSSASEAVGAGKKETEDSGAEQVVPETTSDAPAASVLDVPLPMVKPSRSRR